MLKFIHDFADKWASENYQNEWLSTDQWDTCFDEYLVEDESGKYTDAVQHPDFTITEEMAEQLKPVLETLIDIAVEEYRIQATDRHPSLTVEERNR